MRIVGLNSVIGLICLTSLLLIGDVAIAESPRDAGNLTRGSPQSTTPFLSPRQFLFEQISRSWEPALTRLQQEPVRFQPRPQISRTSGPLRQVTFLGGDRIRAEIVRWENDLVELRVPGGKRVSIPRDAIELLSVPPGELELLSKDFEGTDQMNVQIKATGIHPSHLDSTRAASGQHSLRLTSESQPFQLKFQGNRRPSRIQFWFRADSPASNEDSRKRTSHVQFDFQAASPSTWRLELTPAAVSIRTSSMTELSPVATAIKPGWHCVIAVFDADRSMCLLDDSLLAFTAANPGDLQSIRFSTNAELWIDSIEISEVNNSPSSGNVPSTQDDVVSFSDGISRFGRIKHVDSQHILLSTSGRDYQISWDTVTQLALRQPDRPVRERRPLPAGLIAVVEFQSVVDRPQLPSDRLTVSIQQVTNDLIIAAHPWLGWMDIAVDDIARVTPKYFGRLITWDARQMHLGDSIQAQFHRQLPDATEWKGDFELPEDVVAQNHSFRMEVDIAEMEPSGPDTPPGSPFLRELRQGQLLTELFVNDQPAGSLNEWLRFHAKSEHPEQLQFPIPSRLMKPGRNTFRLKQIPMAKTNHYDNCEISNLRMGIFEAPSPNSR